MSFLIIMYTIIEVSKVANSGFSGFLKLQFHTRRQLLSLFLEYRPLLEHRQGNGDIHHSKRSSAHIDKAAQYHSEEAMN